MALGLIITAVSTPVLGAPFRTPDLDAASTWEIKPSYQWASNGFDSETGFEMDITVPIRPGLETSVTFGSGTFKAPARKRYQARSIANGRSNGRFFRPVRATVSAYQPNQP